MPRRAECNHSNSIRERAGLQKWILTLACGKGRAVYRKDVDGVSAANDTLERLVLP